MKKPIKPELCKSKQEFQETIEQGKFFEIEKAFHDFSKKYNVPFQEITLSVKEDWTGYESCDTYLLLSAIETEECRLQRIARHGEDMKKYKQDIYLYGVEMRREQLEREQVNKIKKIAKIDDEIERLKQLKEAL